MHSAKIVHLIGNLDHGGAERFVIDLCNELARKKQDVTLVSLCLNHPEDSFLRELSPAVNYVCFGKKKGFSLAVLLKLTRWLARQEHGVVHSHLNSSEYLIMYRLMRSGTFFFHTIHNIAEAECPEVLQKFLRQFFYSTKKVVPVTISALCSASYRNYYKLKNDRIIENARLMPLTTSLRRDLLQKYSSPAGEILLLHIGRISREKNQRLLIETVRELNRTEARRCRLLLIGEVKDQLLYTELQLVAQGDPQIEFLGLQKNVADYLSIADAFCLSSDWEGMPISVIEAMSLGCIPVCTAVGGIPDMITDGVNGFLSAPKDAESYAGALRKIISGEGLQQMRMQAVQAYHSRYAIEISANNYIQLYQQAI